MQLSQLRKLAGQVYQLVAAVASGCLSPLYLNWHYRYKTQGEESNEGDASSMPAGEAKQDPESLVSPPGDIQLLYIGTDGPDKLCEALGQCRQRGIPARMLTYLQVDLFSSTPLHI